jgi:hypothetical protein
MGAREDFQTIHLESELKEAEKKIIELKETTIPIAMLEEIVQGAFDRGVKYAYVDAEVRTNIGKKYVVELMKILKQKGKVIANG